MNWEVDYTHNLGDWTWEAVAELEGGLRLVVMGDCDAGALIHEWSAEALLENESGDQLAQADRGQHTFVKDFPGLLEAIGNDEAVATSQKALKEELV